MLTTQIIDIFQAPVQAIVHQCNCFQIMGGGIALALRRRWPAVYRADVETIYGDAAKLGSFSLAKIHDSESPVEYVYNMYSQYEIGNNVTNYVAMEAGLERVRRSCERLGITALGIPYKIGCGLAGGDWTKVEAIINKVFTDVQFDVVICKLP